MIAHTCEVRGVDCLHSQHTINNNIKNKYTYCIEYVLPVKANNKCRDNDYGASVGIYRQDHGGLLGNNQLDDEGMVATLILRYYPPIRLAA